MAFLEDYFIEPFSATYEYNIVNTLTYALLAFGGLFLLYKLLLKKKIAIDQKLAYMIIPYLIFAAIVRAYADNGLIQKTFFSVSPGLYLLTTAIFIVGIILNKPKFTGVISVLYVPIKYGLPQFQNLIYLIFILSIVFAAIWLSIKLAKKLKQRWFNNKLTILAFSGQLFDAINTSFILHLFGGFEKHVLPRFIIEKTGTPFSFIPLKLAILLPILYYLNKSKEKEFSKLILIAAFALGFAQGLRNLINVFLI
jgi:uncharacterized membrane protein